MKMFPAEYEGKFSFKRMTLKLYASIILLANILSWIICLNDFAPVTNTNKK